MDDQTPAILTPPQSCYLLNFSAYNLENGNLFGDTYRYCGCYDERDEKSLSEVDIDEEIANLESAIKFLKLAKENILPRQKIENPHADAIKLLIEEKIGRKLSSVEFYPMEESISRFSQLSSVSEDNVT